MALENTGLPPIHAQLLAASGHEQPHEVSPLWFEHHRPTARARAGRPPEPRRSTRGACAVQRRADRPERGPQSFGAVTPLGAQLPRPPRGQDAHPDRTPAASVSTREWVRRPPRRHRPSRGGHALAVSPAHPRHSDSARILPPARCSRGRPHRAPWRRSQRHWLDL